jgi:Domain of Unknown Function (DUF1080)
MTKSAFVLTAAFALCAGKMSLTAAAANDTINGSVIDSMSNAPIDSVNVSTEGVSTQTMSTGSFKLVIPTTGIPRSQRQKQEPMVMWNPLSNYFSWSGNPGMVSLTVQSLSGRIVAQNRPENNVAEGKLSIASLPQGVYLATVALESKVDVCKIIKFQAGMDNSCRIVSGSGVLAKSKATTKSHVVTFNKNGYRPDTLTVAANTLSMTMITAKLASASAFTVLFDGTNLNNWTYGSNTSLQVQDSAIQMTGCWCMTWSKLTYDNFRLFVTCRVVNTDYTSNPGSEHMGIGIWGAPRKDFVPAGCLEITPQNCWLWDYINNNGPNTNQTCMQTNGGGTAGWNNWKTTEILANLKNGTVKTAVDGVFMTNYKAANPSIWQKGPIGLQDHGSNPVEYKNIKIEVNPTDTNLTSVIK